MPTNAMKHRNPRCVFLGPKKGKVKALPKNVKYVRHGSASAKSRIDRQSWCTPLKALLQMSEKKLIDHLTKTKILKDWDGESCPVCGNGTVHFLRRRPGDRGRACKRGAAGRRAWAPPHHSHPIFELPSGPHGTSLQDQAAVLFCATAGVKQSARHLLAGRNHKVMEGLCKRKRLHEARSKFAEKKQKGMKFGQNGHWHDIEADEVDLRKMIPDSIDTKKKDVSWEQRGGVVERGDPASLVLCRLDPSKTVRRAPGPGAARKRDRAPIAAKFLKSRKVLPHADGARAHKLKTDGVLHDNVAHQKKRVVIKGKTAWIKPSFTKVVKHCIPDKGDLYVKAGTQIIDRAWRHLRGCLEGVPAAVGSDMLRRRVRSAQWAYWMRARDLWQATGDMISKLAAEAGCSALLSAEAVRDPRVQDAAAQAGAAGVAAIEKAAAWMEDHATSSAAGEEQFCFESWQVYLAGAFLLLFIVTLVFICWCSALTLTYCSGPIGLLGGRALAGRLTGTPTTSTSGYLARMANFVEAGGDAAVEQLAQELDVSPAAVRTWLVQWQLLGGWVRDLTEEGVEPNPGPGSDPLDFIEPVRALIDAHAADQPRPSSDGFATPPEAPWPWESRLEVAPVTPPMPRPELQKLRWDLEVRVRQLEQLVEQRQGGRARLPACPGCRGALARARPLRGSHCDSCGGGWGRGGWALTCTPCAAAVCRACAVAAPGAAALPAAPPAEEAPTESLETDALFGSPPGSLPGTPVEGHRAPQGSQEQEEAMEEALVAGVAGAAPEESLQRDAVVGAERVFRRWRSRGDQACVACHAAVPCDKWGYQCTACRVFYCGAACRRAHFNQHECVADVSAGGAGRGGEGGGGRDEGGGGPGEDIRGAIHVLANSDFDSLLEEAVDLPALPTLERALGQLRSRVGVVLRDLLNAHVDSECAASRQPSRGAVAQAARSSRLLWLAPTLLLRHRPQVREEGLESEPPPGPADAQEFPCAAMVRSRLQVAERGDWRLLLEAAGKQSVGAVRAAKALLTGAVRTPLTEATAVRIDELVAEAVDGDEMHEVEAECKRALKDMGKAAAPKFRTIRRKLRVLREAAQCGPSAWRNSFLKNVGSVEGGIKALAWRAQVRKQGRAQDATIELWTAACVTPVDCDWARVGPGQPAQRKLRPIACAEVLMKLVEGACIDEESASMLAALEPRQLGCGAPDGAPLIVHLARSWAERVQAASEPEDDPFVAASVDLENAYGRAFRSSCLRGCRKRLPAIAALAAAQWRTGRTAVWQRADGRWRRSWATRGGWQGARLMQLMFAMGLEDCLEAVPELDDAMGRVGYQDDTYLFSKAAHFADSWPVLQGALAQGGHRVRNHKCKFWAPSCDDSEPGHAAQHLGRLAALLPRAWGGLELLGGAVQGEFAAEVGRDGLLLGPARARARKAAALARRVEEFAAAQPAVTAAHLAWSLLSKSVAHALSYDARLAPSTVLGAVAEPVSNAVEEALQHAVVARRLDEGALRQMRLCGAFGGLGLRREGEGAVAADALAARQRLEDAGVVVDLQGGAMLTDDAQAECSGGPWSKDVAVDDLGGLELLPEASLPLPSPGDVPARAPRRLASRIFRHLDAVRATQLWQELGQERREGLLSSGGPGAEALWMQLPAKTAEWFPSSYFRVATMRRLGALSAPPGATCRLPCKAGNSDEACGHRLDPTLQHPQLCKQGPARMRPHRALAAALARLLRECRAEIDIERTVPELIRVLPNGAVQEAVLDLVVTFPGSVQPLYIDVSIRCPHAARYAQAQASPGDAANAAVDDKMRRYGSDVLTVALESYGRLAAGTHWSLEHLATHAAASLRDQWAAPRLVPRWRAALERAVAFAAADIDLLSLGAAPLPSRRG
ncbi:unnamed protein product [Prorocentrum cordatum]|uniref:Uncharacterized protein n=1 Tax=Prorocentrum cordatum TaxID=2364126 RepID=A0ABN9PPP9_9DINO|nr:unnamed protein product [Polarella glacialis]